jgi:AcrR family transcriptional regulator
MTTARGATDATGEGHAGRARRGRPRTGAREAVLAATEVLLAESGVARLTTKELSQRAGVAESSIYYHFGDRLGLLQAVVAASLPLYKDSAAHLRDRAGQGTLRDNLIELVAALETFSLRVQPIIAAVQADAELRTVFTQRSRDLDIGPHRAVEPTLEYLVCERDAGRIGPDSDLHSVAYLLVSAAQHRALLRHLAGSVPRVLPPATQLVDALLPLLAVHRPATQ